MRYDRYSQYNRPGHRLNKMKIGIIIGVIIIVVAGIFLFLNLGSNDETNDNQEIININNIGDATVDPENLEMKEKDGKNVNADELLVSHGKSNGIDVSKWQGKIDWKKVKNDNIDFAFIRIGYRGENGIIYKDDNADYNIQQAIKNNVLVGTYFFSTAVNEKEAIEEAKWTLKAIEGYSISYPVVYDCEGYKDSNSRMNSLDSNQRTLNAKAYLKTVADAGYDVMFYGSLSDIQDEDYWNMAEIEDKYKIWIAQYSSMIYPDKEKPDYDGLCHAWQYTNKGNVRGIDGNVDMVVCYFTKNKAKPKNKNVTPDNAKAPLTDEEKIYTSVNETVTAKDKVNLRKSATTKSDIVGTLKNGDNLKRIATGTNGWSKLKYNNKTVYAISSYLTTDLSIKTPETPKEDIVAGHTFTPKNDKVTAKEKVNLRSLPTTDGELIGTLNSGDFLKRTAISNKGWSRLSYNGQTVYAVTSYLSNEVVKVEKPEESKPSVSDGFASVDEQVTAKDETNLRSLPSTQNSEVIYKLKNGEYVKRIGINSATGWSKLEYNGKIVYAISSYLTE